MRGPLPGNADRRPWGPPAWSHSSARTCQRSPGDGDRLPSVPGACCPRRTSRSPSRLSQRRRGKRGRRTGWMWTWDPSCPPCFS